MGGGGGGMLWECVHVCVRNEKEREAAGSRGSRRSDTLQCMSCLSIFQATLSIRELAAHVINL